jgi:TetR/AcrR family transcriptional regulator
VVATRRVGTEMSATRAVILDTTEQLMVEEGYAAISTRRVAAEAGLKPALVHYYFVTTDDLFLATYRRAADRYFERLTAALEAPRPVAAMWKLSMNPTRTTLAVEFMALANHRKSIRAEIARNIERTREVHTTLLSRLPRSALNDPKICPPITVSLLIAALTRALVMEDALGVTSGHAEAEAFVSWWITCCEGGPRLPAKRKRVAKAKKK